MTLRHAHEIADAHRHARQPIDEGTPVSVKIRERLQAARKRFHANDNIADFIEPGELEQLLDEVDGKMQGVLDSLVIDTESDHNTQRHRAPRRQDVPERGVQGPLRARARRSPSFPNVEHLNELMIVGPITVRSACSHHFCPVIGKVWIGVMPNEHTNVIGLSKYARLAEWVMSRPQIQEEAVIQLADLIQDKTQPDGLAIVMEADHFCMAWRGVKDMDTKMINSVMRGVFLKDPNLRREFLSLIQRSQRHLRTRYHARPTSLRQPRRRRRSRPRPSNPSWRSRASTTRPAASPASCATAAASSCRRSKAAAMPVSELYGHIQRDPRHQDVVLLHYEEITERRFGGWTMGQVNLAKVNPSILLKYSEKPSSIPTRCRARSRWRCSRS